jgi:hypothetical protein
LTVSHPPVLAAATACSRHTAVLQSVGGVKPQGRVVRSAKDGKAARGRARSSPLTPAKRAAIKKAQARAHELDGMALLARMDPDDGLWSWKSSPHVLWLANVLEGKL